MNEWVHCFASYWRFTSCKILVVIMQHYECIISIWWKTNRYWFLSLLNPLVRIFLHQIFHILNFFVLKLLRLKKESLIENHNFDFLGVIVYKWKGMEVQKETTNGTYVFLLSLPFVIPFSQPPFSCNSLLDNAWYLFIFNFFITLASCSILLHRLYCVNLCCSLIVKFVIQLLRRFLFICSLLVLTLISSRVSSSQIC